jgi:hypothetical protein
MNNNSSGITDSLLLSDSKSIKFSVTPAVDENIFTGDFYGVNWADTRDNFINGVLYLSGLSSSDSYSSASTVADTVISQMMSLLGSNCVRMPINESTISGYWSTYTGAIDKALSKGKVILCYWAYSGGKPANVTNFWDMWTTVVNRYGTNNNCYFEPINEPYGYSDTGLCNLYYSWITKYSSVSQSRVILDGSGYAQNVSAVGGDSRLSSCSLAVHDYSMFVSSPYTTEAAWANHIAGYVGIYSSRTICTEWGYPCSPGNKNGISYSYIDYSPGLTSNYFYYYARGIANQLNSWGMGSIYWPGLRDGDWYSMTQKSGNGSSITLSIPNASALTNLKRSWGMTTSVERFAIDLPTHFNLEQNYPNPFNPATTISFSLPSKSFVSLKVYDTLGREVFTILSEELSAGTYSKQLNVADLPSGVYFYRLHAGSYIGTKKIVLLK